MNLFLTRRAWISGWAACVAQEPGSVFQAGVRLVEILVTVSDGDRYVDGLRREDFEVLDQGLRREVTLFEARESSPLSCTLLLDMTGSMREALPQLKNAAIDFIAQLGNQDAVSVLAFNQKLVTLQDFTADKGAARQAVLRTRPSGATAVFDALAEAAVPISQRRGRKAILLFTDGDDNSSLLQPTSAVQRARRAGVPIFTVAEGAATKDSSLRDLLRKLAEETGGLSFEADRPKDLAEMFAKVREDLSHAYLIAFQVPGELSSGQWRALEVRTTGKKKHKVRARRGYFS